MIIKTRSVKNNVKMFREKKGFSREELADQVLVSKQMIRSIERGVFLPSIMAALKIAETLEVDVNELFSLDGGE
jgi:putative transcriptional regulator